MKYVFTPPPKFVVTGPTATFSGPRIGGPSPHCVGSAKEKKNCGSVKILSGYQLTSFCTSFPTYYGFEKDGFYPQNLVSW